MAPSKIFFVTAENVAAEEDEEDLDVLGVGFVQMKEQMKAMGTTGKEQLETESLQPVGKREFLFLRIL